MRPIAGSSSTWRIVAIWMVDVEKGDRLVSAPSPTIESRHTPGPSLARGGPFSKSLLKFPAFRVDTGSEDNLQRMTGNSCRAAHCWDRRMRITNNLIQLSSLANIQRSLAGMHAAHDRVASGLRIQKASDDPVGAMESMRARGSLRALDQYRRGIQTATMQANAEEQALDQMTGLLIRARELATLYAS